MCVCVRERKRHIIVSDRHQEADSVRRELETDSGSPRHQRGNSVGTKSSSSSVTGLSAVSSSSPAGASQTSNSTANASTTATVASVSQPSSCNAVSLQCVLIRGIPLIDSMYSCYCAHQPLASVWCWFGCSNSQQQSSCTYATWRDRFNC